MATRTRNEWEDAICGTADPPSLEQLTKFMEHRMHTIEAISKASSSFKSDASSRSTRSHLVKKTRYEEGPKRCPCCTKNHYVLFCDKFKQKEANEQKDIVEKNSLCLNCLGKHSVSDCLSQKTCSRCSSRHHTTLHDAIAKPTAVATESPTTSHVAHRQSNAVVILATARVFYRD